MLLFIHVKVLVDLSEQWQFMFSIFKQTSVSFMVISMNVFQPMPVCLLQFSIQDNGSAKFFQGALHTPNMGEKVAQVSVLCHLLTSTVTWPQKDVPCFSPLHIPFKILYSPSSALLSIRL